MDDFMKSFNEWYVDVLKNKYTLFTGRARRKEFWMFTLFNILVSLVISIAAAILGNIPILGVIFAFLPLVYCLAVLVPGIALGIRRLHDTNRSGWFLLLCLIPFVGGIILLVFFVLEGTKGQNQFGPDPKA